MSTEEKETFKNKLASDEMLQAEFEEYQIGMVAGQRIQYLELKDKVSQIILDEDEKKEKESNPGRLNVLKYSIRFSAAIAAVFIFLVFYIPSTYQPGNALFTESETKPSTFISRGTLYSQNFARKNMILY
ncbi:MAG: hypothetical protein AAGA77_19350 [Bacteroidota bacterium]